MPAAAIISAVDFHKTPSARHGEVLSAGEGLGNENRFIMHSRILELSDQLGFENEVSGKITRSHGGCRGERSAIFMWRIRHEVLRKSNPRAEFLNLLCFLIFSYY
jgi:hypothetical protein